MDKLVGMGFEVDLPDGWDGRIYRRGDDALAATARTLHAANFPLPVGRGDYGGGVHEQMAADDVLVTLVEFDPGNSNSALFAQQGVPVPLRPESFSPAAMPRTVPGKAGAQFFFSIGDRAFSMFIVIGNYSNRARLVPVVNSVVETLQIEA